MYSSRMFLNMCTYVIELVVLISVEHYTNSGKQYATGTHLPMTPTVHYLCTYLTGGSSRSIVQAVEPLGSGRVLVGTALLVPCGECVLSRTK